MKPRSQNRDFHDPLPPDLDRDALSREIRRYAEAHADGPADLDLDLESTGIAELLRLGDEE